MVFCGVSTGDRSRRGRARSTSCQRRRRGHRPEPRRVPPCTRSARTLETRRARRRAVRPLPHPRRADRCLLPRPGAPRRRDRRARERDARAAHATSSSSASRSSSAISSGLRRIVGPERDIFRRAGQDLERSPGLEAGDARLLPRRLRTTSSASRDTHRRLPRPAHERDGRLPLDGVEPAERRHGATDHRGDDLPAPHPADRLLRHELRLAGAPHRVARGVLGASASAGRSSRRPGRDPSSGSAAIA